MAEKVKVNACQYLFANRGAGMSPAKLSAQVAHAAVLSFAYHMREDTPVEVAEMAYEWMTSGHYTKVVLLAEDEQHIDNINDYLKERGIATFMVIDEGRTEVRPFTKTALGCEIVDKNDPRIQDVFGHFQIYKELPKQPPEATPSKKLGKFRK